MNNKTIDKFLSQFPVSPKWREPYPLRFTIQRNSEPPTQHTVLIRVRPPASIRVFSEWMAEVAP